jgi:Bacterial SH3 domain
MMSPSNSILLLGLTIATALATSCCSPNAASAGTYACYEVQDPDGWSYVRRLEDREIVGKLNNGITFQSVDQTEDGRVIIGRLGGVPLAVARSRVRPVSNGKCRFKHLMVSDRDGYINLRSAPNGSIIGRVSHQATVLYLESSSDRTWSHVITPQGEIGWIHSSRLAEISN